MNPQLLLVFREKNKKKENPTKSTYYKTLFPEEKLSDFDEWKTFKEGNNGWLRISSRDEDGLKSIHFAEDYYRTECEFWDSLNLY